MSKQSFSGACANFSLLDYQQVEWNFPIENMTLRLEKPSPEAKAVMKIIRDVKSNSMHSLHVSCFGRVCFCVSDRCKLLHREFLALNEFYSSYPVLLYLLSVEAFNFRECGCA